MVESGLNPINPNRNAPAMRITRLTARQTNRRFFETGLLIFRFLPLEIAECYFIFRLCEEHIQTEAGDSERACRRDDRAENEDQPRVEHRTRGNEAKCRRKKQKHDVRVDGESEALFITRFDGRGERFAGSKFFADVFEGIPVEEYHDRRRKRNGDNTRNGKLNSIDERQAQGLYRTRFHR